MSISQRSRVIQLYKTLIHLGRDYPQNPRGFQANVHRVFMKNRDVREEHTIEALIAQGQYVVKELEALYMLKKYRTLKRRYDRSLDP
ncbi:electron transfer flavoprotein regulatory factor 1-like [Tigriopus californicus]|uniref:electron transfer flavoprotein regulatory factor 1-like n=1 Tax=Tigriopus californicus TaxID=6832 RepID=UPI0027DA58A6|nr:electron transfer flavoprotein regulatory factor 1-like [Tigriopus californicus]